RPPGPGVPGAAGGPGGGRARHRRPGGRAVHGRRVRARDTARLAPRRTALRHRRGRLARLRMPDAPPSIPAGEGKPGTRARPRAAAALRVRARGRRTLALAARDLADEGSPLLDHVPHDPGPMTPVTRLPRL